MSRFIICAFGHSSREKTMQNTTTFQVQGMTCGHCERAVTQAVQQLDAGATVHIDRAAGTVVVHSTATRDALAAAITEEGYTVAA
jgi:copper chaperone